MEPTLLPKANLTFLGMEEKREYLEKAEKIINECVG
jgi:hypothetical protein